MHRSVTLSDRQSLGGRHLSECMHDFKMHDYHDVKIRLRLLY